MRFGVLLMAVLIAGCAGSAYYIEPGKYRDWADYWVATDPSLARDVASIGGGQDDLRCVAGYQSDVVWGAGSRGWLDDFATGRQIMKPDDKGYIEALIKQGKAEAGTPEAFYGEALTWCRQNATSN
jgi:hypothetical protein